MIFQTVFILKKDLFLKKYLVLSSPNNKNVKILSHLPKAHISSLSYPLQKNRGFSAQLMNHNSTNSFDSFFKRKRVTKEKKQETKDLEKQRKRKRERAMEQETKDLEKQSKRERERDRDVE